MQIDQGNVNANLSLQSHPHGLTAQFAEDDPNSLVLRESPEGNLRGFGRVPCFPEFPEYQARNFGQRKIRLNSLHSDCGTNSGFPWLSAISLIEGHYEM
jgi:hypothetical protein